MNITLKHKEDIASEGIWLRTSEEFSSRGPIVSDHANHFVQLRAHLDAASESAV